jgi:hypothetical protein
VLKAGVVCEGYADQEEVLAGQFITMMKIKSKATKPVNGKIVVNHSDEITRRDKKLAKEKRW